MALHGGTLLTLCAVLTAVAGAAMDAPAHFYPYGPGVGDSTAPVNDDGSTDSVTISASFPYFDVLHTSLYVSTCFMNYNVYLMSEPCTVMLSHLQTNLTAATQTSTYTCAYSIIYETIFP